MQLLFRPLRAEDETAARKLLQNPQSRGRGPCDADWHDLFDDGTGSHLTGLCSNGFISPQQRTCFYVGYVGDNLAGVAVATQKDNGNLFINHIAVLPAFRGRGIGRWMLTCVEAVAQNANCKKMSFRTTAMMSDLLHLCSRFGFQETHRMISTDGANHQIRVNMEKIL